MRVDLTLQVNVKKSKEITSHKAITAFGHLGTHIDVVEEEFSLDNFRRTGKLVNVSSVGEREIELGDFDDVILEKNDFVLLYTGFIDRIPYGSRDYFKLHPQLSVESIGLLLQKKVSLIGIDAPGLRRGADHPKVDRLCAARNIFVVENLVNLGKLSKLPKNHRVTVYTLPVNMTGSTGIPCRVIAEY